MQVIASMMMQNAHARNIDLIGKDSNSLWDSN